MISHQNEYVPEILMIAFDRGISKVNLFKVDDMA